MEYLFTDPRADIIRDTTTWNRLLRLIHTLEDKSVALIIQKRLWTLRSAGTMLKPTRSGLKFVPLIGEGSDWDSEEEFESMKKTYLGPYSKEISELLRKVMEK